MEHKLGQFMMKSSSLKHIETLMERYPQLEVCKKDILSSVEMLIETFQTGKKLLVCGNGGSASDSEHIVGELMKGFILPRKLDKDLVNKINDEELSSCLQYGLPAISLVSEVALSTAFSNDQLPSAVFAQQVLGYGKKGDTLLCISTSGNSLNCIYAAKVAKAIGMNVISLTGKKNSKLELLSDLTIKATESETFKIQELHLPIYHAICLALEEEFFGLEEN